MEDGLEVERLLSNSAQSPPSTLSLSAYHSTAMQRRTATWKKNYTNRSYNTAASYEQHHQKTTKERHLSHKKSRTRDTPS